MKYFLGVVIVVLVSSCASGPSKEEVARRQAENLKKQANANLLVDIFINEFWNQPIGKFLNKLEAHDSIANYYFATAKVSSFSRALITGNIAEDIKLDYTNCRKPSEYNKFVVVGSARSIDALRGSSGYKKNSSSFNFGYDFSRESTETNKCESFTYGARSYDAHNNTSRLYTPMVNAWELREMFLLEGVPLLHCFEPKTLRHRPGRTNLLCVFDEGSRNGIAQPTLEITTERGSLKAFEITGINFNAADLKKTFHQVYKERFSSPRFLEILAKYKNWIKRSRELVYAVDKAEEERENAELQRAIRAREMRLNAERRELNKRSHRDFVSSMKNNSFQNNLQRIQDNTMNQLQKSQTGKTQRQVVLSYKGSTDQGLPQQGSAPQKTDSKNQKVKLQPVAEVCPLFSMYIPPSAYTKSDKNGNIQHDMQKLKALQNQKISKHKKQLSPKCLAEFETSQRCQRENNCKSGSGGRGQ